MYSFYGGKEGRTYDLVAHYDSIYQMVCAFQDGAANVDAKYNEYVIIDTIVNRNDKTDPENGIIYRRGLNFNEKFDPQNILAGDKSNSLSPDDTIEITLKGQIDQKYTDETIPETGTEIVWPVPRFKHYEYYLRNGDDGLEVELHPGELIVDETDTPLFNIVWKNFVTNPGGGAEYVGQVVGPQGESPLTQLVDWDTFEEEYLHNVDNTEPVKGELLAIRRPGYDGTEYNDDIKYGYCNVRDDQGNVYGAVLSMDLPYTVFKFEFESGSAYGPVTRTVPTYQDLPSEIDVDKNVYYHVLANDKYYIWDDTRKIVTIVNEVENEAALPAAENVNPKQLYYRLDNTSYYIGHVSSTYDPEEQEEIYTVEWEQVNYTSYLSDPGFVETELWAVDTSDSNSAEWKYTNMLREYADSQGHNFYKHYNITIPKGVHGTDFVRFDNVNPENEYDLVYRWRTYEEPETKEQGTDHSISIGTLKVIKDTEMLSGTSETPISWIRINYFTKDENEEYEYDDIPIRRIERVRMNGQGGIEVTYITGNNTSTVRLNDGFPLQWITNITLEPDTKQVRVTYNTINEATQQNNYWISDEQLRTVETIGIENDRDLVGQKTFYYEYNVGDLDPENPGQALAPVHIPIGTLALNEIVDVQLVGDNIAVLYSDATLRQSVYNSGNYYKLEYTGTLWNATTPDVREGSKNYFYWANLGPSLSGEHIFGYFNDINTLKNTYPYGFGLDENGNVPTESTQPQFNSIGRQGWVASVAITVGGQPGIGLYAYDYTKTPSANNWYEISSIVQNEIDPRTIMMIDTENNGQPATSVKEATLSNNGYWFIASDVTIATEL